MEICDLDGIITVRQTLCSVITRKDVYLLKHESHTKTEQGMGATDICLVPKFILEVQTVTNVSSFQMTF